MNPIIDAKTNSLIAWAPILLVRRGGGLMGVSTFFTAGLRLSFDKLENCALQVRVGQDNGYQQD